jgi:hypothetical protein
LQILFEGIYFEFNVLGIAIKLILGMVLFMNKFLSFCVMFSVSYPCTMNNAWLKDYILLDTYVEKTRSNPCRSPIPNHPKVL